MSSTKRHIVLLFNPHAGSGRGVSFIHPLTEYLSQQQLVFTVFSKDWPKDLLLYSDAWIIGGDGTLNFFVNRYPDCSIPITVFPGGSGNDFFWLLYGDRSFPELVEIALRGKLTHIDAGICNEKLFLNGIGVGFDGSIAQSLMRKNKKPGIASYWTAVIRQLFFYRERSYVVQSHEYAAEGKHLLIDCMNGKRSGGGFLVAPEASASDGLLDVMLCTQLKWWKRLRYLPVIQKGLHTRLPFVTCYRTRELRISTQNYMEAHMDGEFMQAREMMIRILPGKFLFRIP